MRYVPCRHVPEVGSQPSEGGVVNSQGPVCPKGLDVDAKDVGDLERLIGANVRPRLPRQIWTQEQNGPSIDSHASGRGGKITLTRAPCCAPRASLGATWLAVTAKMATTAQLISD